MKQNVFSFFRLFASIFIVCFIAATLITVSAFAEDKVYDRENGDPNSSEADNITVTLHDNNDNTFSAIVSGSGAMKDYAMFNQVPWAEYRTKITSVTVTENVSHIGNCAFSMSSMISNISLSDSVKTIGDYSFQGNAAEEVVIPKGVESFNHTSFGGSNNIIVVKGNNTKLADKPSTLAGKKVIAYEDSYIALNWEDTYQDNYGRQMDNRNVLEAISSYEEDPGVPSRSTSYIANGSNIVIPARFKTIGSNTFKDNTDLKSVDLNKVTTIEANAFSNCASLESVLIPRTVETIDAAAFSGCDNLETIYGNSGSSAQSFAEQYNYSFAVLKPFRNEGINAINSYEITTGDAQDIDLTDVFGTKYESTLKYQVKANDGDYQDIKGTKYTFDAQDEGEYSFVFRAVDSYGEISDDTYTVNYDVINNSVPVLNPDKTKLEYAALMGEQFRIDLTDVFTDADGDSLYYMWTELEDGEIDWDYQIRLSMVPGTESFDTPIGWTSSLDYSLGKERVFFVKAYDEYDKPSEDCYEIRIKTHSVDVVVNKGIGVRSLEGITFSFESEDADTVTNPAEIVGNHYYFDLEYDYSYNSAHEKVFEDSFTYSYAVNLEGCEPITGTYYTDVCQDREENTIEVTLANPAQAEADAKAVADLIKAIDNLGDITLESEDAVNAAQAAYEALYDDLKPQVTNYEVLHLSKLVLSSLKAQKAAEEAQAAAEEAERKAKIEQQNAKDAQDKAETAQQKAEEAQSKAETAQEAAEKAKGEAEAAKLAAETAKGEAEAAKQAAETAKGEAEKAKAEAETAKQAAETAKAEAEAAQQKAEKAAQEASSSDSETSKQIKELQDSLEKTAAELAALKDTLAAKENKVTGLKLKSKARKITVTWKKNADADGYQVQFKLKSAKKYKTLKTLTGIKAVSKKLKKGKKYQFRVATYKTVNGKKIYGKWAIKTVKCK